MAFFFEDDFSRLVEKAIEEAELLTSAEFKLHIEEVCNEEVLDRNCIKPRSEMPFYCMSA